METLHFSAKFFAHRYFLRTDRILHVQKPFDVAGVLLRVALVACCLAPACFILFAKPTTASAEPDTLPPLKDGRAPTNYAQMWSGFDPRAEPLEVETIHEWEEQGVVLRIVRFRIGVFKGKKAMLAAVFGFPKGGENLPGLVQIHGGGQYADHKACLMNAKRGYATVSIAWAGRISAPEYAVGPNEVKLFWEQKTDDPKYKVTTDWGAVDGYHAPGRNAGNQFPSAKAADWTLDAVESPRNSGWFLCAVAARRALTFLEQQPQVDADRLGVYGHSMGGKLTVMTAPDPRVKAAAPSCGGISDRDNRSELFRTTVGDDVSLQQITCPIIFLSPANDFHGRLGDLPDAIDEINSTEWRVTCSPHHNHQDTSPYEVATLLWFDQYLKNDFQWPETPQVDLKLNAQDGVPTVSVMPDASRPLASVDIYYTQQGKPDETSADHYHTIHRYWRHTAGAQADERWTASLPLISVDKPLWVYANITYKLPETVEGAGYYYRIYAANSFNLSSLVQKVSPQQLQAAGVRTTLQPTITIEDFQGDWGQEWFTYRPNEWSLNTNKLHDEQYHAPAEAKLAIDVRANEQNQLVVQIDEHVAAVKLSGGDSWQTIVLSPGDLKNFAGEGLTDWKGVRLLTLTAAARLRPPRGDTRDSRVVGGNWRGKPPHFRNLRWETTETEKPSSDQ